MLYLNAHVITGRGLHCGRKCEISPSELIKVIEGMSLVQKTSFVLNACDTPYVKEWTTMYDATSNYIFYMNANYDSANSKI